jgi:hypothetical protein
MIGSESWGFPGGRLRIQNKKAGLTRHFELARGLEPLTCCLQDSCATDCATPASAGPAYPTYVSAGCGCADRPPAGSQTMPGPPTKAVP